MYFIEILRISKNKKYKSSQMFIRARGKKCFWTACYSDFANRGNSLKRKPVKFLTKNYILNNKRIKRIFKSFKKLKFFLDARGGAG